MRKLMVIMMAAALIMTTASVSFARERDERRDSGRRDSRRGDSRRDRGGRRDSHRGGSRHGRSSFRSPNRGGISFNFGLGDFRISGGGSRGRSRHFRRTRPYVRVYHYDSYDYAPRYYVPEERHYVVPRTERLIDQLLYARDDDDREDAAKNLGKLKAREAVSALIRAMRNDAEDDVREEAAKALGKIGTLEAIEPLRRTILDDPSKKVRKAAEKALEKIEDRYYD